MRLPTSPAQTRTRHQILHLLKQEGALDSAQLAAQLGVSAMAVRQHLYALQKQGLVTYQEAAPTVGCPAKQWQLTSAAEPFFPTGYVDLTVNLLQGMRDEFGPEGVDKVLLLRMNQQIAAYQAHLRDCATWQQKVVTLAHLRTAEGYMAAVVAGEAGELLLVENHCPICVAAQSCGQFCARELETFQRVLGEAVLVERTEHIMAGARRCVYRITPQSR